MSVDLEAAVQFNRLFQYSGVATETGMEAQEDASEINPPALSQLLREALPISQPGELTLEYPFNVLITAVSIAGDDYNQYFPDTDSALDKTDTGQVTDIGISISLAGLDTQPDQEGSPFINPRALYRESTRPFDQDTVVANYLLAAGVRRQIGRIKTGFSQPHDTKDMYNFARKW